MSAEWHLAKAFLASHPRNAARILDQAEAGTSAKMLSRAAPRAVAETLEQMDSTSAARVLCRLPSELSSEVLTTVSLAVAVSMLRNVDPAERERLLGSVPDGTARSVRTALFHPDGTAGAMMDSNALALSPEITAEEARRSVRQRSRPAGNYLYVVDDQRRLIGVVGLGELMTASPKTLLGSLMTTQVMRIRAQAGVGPILSHPGWRELHALPVVDSAEVLVGVLRRASLERLRDQLSRGGAGAGRGSLSLALAELFWSLGASAVDELSQAVRPVKVAGRSEDRDGD